MTWDRLVDKDLACPPVVTLPEPMVTVSLGSRAELDCQVTSSPRAHMAGLARLPRLGREATVSRRRRAQSRPCPGHRDTEAEDWRPR